LQRSCFICLCRFDHRKVLLPTVKMQREIGKILTTADNEINAIEDYRNALERQKRGLMQKLLTGEVRVSV